MRRILPLLCTLSLIACPGGGDTPDGGTTPDAGLPAPSITSVTDSSGPAEGGVLVTVLGTNFQTGATLRFGAAEATHVTVASASRITARTPAGTPGPVDVVVKNPDGKEGVIADGYSYFGPVVIAIEETVLGHGLLTRAGGDGERITFKASGLLHIPQVTNGQGDGAAAKAVPIRAEVGVSKLTADKVTVYSAEAFEWAPATWVGDAPKGTTLDVYDRYEGTLSVPGVTGNEEVRYLLVTRFSLDDGATWHVGDRDGSRNGVAVAQLGNLIASRPVAEFCNLQWPFNTRVTPGGTSEKVYGRIFHPGLTEAQGASPAVVMELGYGTSTSTPETWTWIPGTYNEQKGEGQDEYMAAIAAPPLGSFFYAWRARINGGPAVYCTREGAANSLDTQTAGSLKVEDVKADWCNLQWPFNLSGAPGQVFSDRSAGIIYGRVREDGVTDQAGHSTEVLAEVGYGLEGTDPSTWTWSAAIPQASECLECPASTDEYEFQLTAPATPGTYRYTYRMTLQGGSPLLCDRDGNDGSAGGFDLEQTGRLTVIAPGTETVDYCAVILPTTMDVLSGGILPLVQAQVYAAGRTNGPAGAAAGVTGQFGHGPTASAPGSGDWTWTDGAFSQEIGNNDEWVMDGLAAPAAGSYDYAFRFRIAQGPYTYCDTDWGADAQAGVYSPAEAGKLVVRPPQGSWTPTTAACRLQVPAIGSIPQGQGAALSAHLHVPGLTPAAGQAAGLTAEVGIGPVGSDASIAASWTWSAATYAADVDGQHDAYAATIAPALTGPRAVAFRFKQGGGAWTHCDLDGSDVGGFTPDQQATLTITPHAELEYCKLQWPQTITAAEHATGTTVVYGRLYEPGLTTPENDATDAPPRGVTAQLGHGPADRDPGLAWSWTEAAYLGRGDTADNFEFSAILPPAAAVGERFVMRFFGPGPTVPCYGDLQPDGVPGGSANGLTPTTAGELTP